MKGVDTKHKLYCKQLPSWNKCRIVAEGSEAIKEKGVEYLPQLEDQSPTEYEAYKNRALFFEGTTRTITGLTGMMFAKEPILTCPKGSSFFEKITPSFVPIKTFLKNTAGEVVTVGRLGLLVDVGVGGSDEPYISQYKTEDILNWRTELVDGKQVLTHVVLREESTIFRQFEETTTEQFRVLRLIYVDGVRVYTQELYIKSTNKSSKGEFSLSEGYPLFPEKKGARLEQIPFYFINANGTQPSPVRPPLIGLVNVNLSHYMNSADLEHGRHFTGLPTPWVSGFSLNENQKLSIGSQVAWVSTKPDAKAGFLEFTGQGLSTLENALKEKQDMMIVLGSRVLEAPKKASESADNQKNKKQGESSILANIADSVSEGVTAAIKFAADWGGEDPKDFSVEIHKDFVTMEANPQMITAMMGALQGGVMSFETWFYNLKQAGMIPDGVTVDEERDRIDAMNAAFTAEGGNEVE